jgi:hypothetical protein
MPDLPVEETRSFWELETMRWRTLALVELVALIGAVLLMAHMAGVF